jgi:8-oxo-dGTP pyrophosphatase MutT (NUDIX family)
MITQFSSGNILLDFFECDEPLLPADDLTPLTWTLTVVRKGDRYLLHHNAKRHKWECAGGGWEADETLDACAAREIWEETNQKISNLRHIGVFKLYLRMRNSYKYGSLYTATIDTLLPFEPNSESDRITLWHPSETLDGKISELSLWMIEKSQELGHTH